MLAKAPFAGLPQLRVLVWQRPASKFSHLVPGCHASANNPLMITQGLLLIGLL